MKKRLPAKLFLSALALFAGGAMVLSGCGRVAPSSSSSSGAALSSASTSGTSHSSSSTATSSSSSSDATIAVTSVTIAAPDSLKVVDNSNLSLKATVLPATASNTKVTWSSSDEAIATVTNGIVKFKSVAVEATVTIAATSKADATKHDALTFTVEHGVINFATSRGTNLDTSMYLDDGSVSVDPGDTALIYSDVASAKWYVEAGITIDSFNEADIFPKVGIMTSNKDDGYWNEDTSEANGFFYVDSALSGKTAGWTSFNFVKSNDAFTDWDWNNQLGAFAVDADSKVTLGSKFKMGLLRDGADYYALVGKVADSALTCYKHFVWKGLAADAPSHAWVGGWNTGFTATGFKAVTGAAVDALFDAPTALTLNYSKYALVYDNASQGTIQLSASTDKLFSAPMAVTWSTSDATVATVDETGLVTAQKKDGSAIITATAGTLSATSAIAVSYGQTAYDRSNAVGTWDFSKENSNGAVSLASKTGDSGMAGYVGLKNMSGTKWYVRATIAVDRTNAISDDYSKIGLAGASNDVNSLVWLAEDGHVGGTNELMVGITRIGGTWNWTPASGYCDAAGLLYDATPTMDLGMLRNGLDYYYFLNGGIIAKWTDDRAVFDASTASIPTFLEFGGLGMTISSLVTKTGADVDAIVASLGTATVGKWTKTGDVAITDDATFAFGSGIGSADVTDGINSLTYSDALAAPFKISFTISDYYSTAANWYYPQVGLKLGDDVVAYAVRTAAVEKYARLESCMGGNWSNGANFADPSTYDATSAHAFALTVDASGLASATLDGAAVTLGDGMATRTLAKTTGLAVGFYDKKCSAKISNFAIAAVG